MLLQTILVIILLLNLRKETKGKNGLQQWDKLIITAICISAALFVLHNVFLPVGGLLIMLSYGVTAAVIYTVYTNTLFTSGRALLNAFWPLFVLNFIEDVITIIDKPFYKSWRNYIEGAELLALVWMIAMLIINNKQKKALEKERLINEEKEKEYRITEHLKAQLEIQVQERTTEITKQKEELQKTLHELESTQSQLIHAEKMASLGELTAGIAHEIQNPLNFVNNFSEINGELLEEMKVAIENQDYEEVKALISDITENEKKINLHGKRADSIVKGMLQHSRTSTGQKELTDINALCDECMRLSYHGLRAKDKTFNAGFETKFDEQLSKINVLPQEIGRVILNLCNNAFYATNAKKKTAGNDYKPTVTIKTAAADNGVEIRVHDNGSGIPQQIIDKIFQPFFTTKPTGQGTGLGLSMSYDIITKAHNGTLQVESQENIGTTFIINLPY